MKRLTSLDFLRGLAIIFMTAVHILLSVWYLIGHVNISLLKVWMYPFAGIIILIVHWRGFFIIISSIVTYYRMAEAIKRGKNYAKVLLNEIIYALILLVIAKIYDTFFTTWGIFDELTRTGVWNVDYLNLFYFAEALDVIALGIIFSAILFFVLHPIKQPWIHVLIYFSLGCLIFLISPIVQDWVNTLAVWPPEILPDDSLSLQFTDHFKDDVVYPLRRMILVWIGGREAPLFPMLGVTFIGTCIGVLISQEKPKLKHIHIGFLGALMLILIGGIVLILEIVQGTFVFDPGFHIHPVWFVFINTAFQSCAILLLFRLVEFNSKLNQEKWLKYSLPIRRWGMIALTIYIYQWFDGLIRWLFAMIFHLNLAERYTVNKWWTLAMMICAILMWQGLIWLWEKIHFIGTWEFGLRILRALFTGEKIQVKNALRIQEKLYDVEMVHFVWDHMQPPSNSIQM